MANLAMSEKKASHGKDGHGFLLATVCLCVWSLPFEIKGYRRPWRIPCKMISSASENRNISCSLHVRYLFDGLLVSRGSHDVSYAEKEAVIVKYEPWDLAATSSWIPA